MTDRPNLTLADLVAMTQAERAEMALLPVGQVFDILATQLLELDELLDELAEHRARGDVTDADASQAYADIRLIQNLAGPALAAGDLLTVSQPVLDALVRLANLVVQDRLF